MSTTGKTQTILAIQNHLNRFWPNRAKRDFVWTAGRSFASFPDFRVCRVEPEKPKEGYIYVTIGCWKIHSRDHQHCEFFILSSDEDPIHVETLAMVANFHADPRYGVWLGKTINIGRPWVDGSNCDHLLVSLPYTLGKDFEWCSVGEFTIRFLWLLPITAAEAEFLSVHGQEALEQKFDESDFNIYDSHRASIV